jgi:RHS repeat-associated protein
VRKTVKFASTGAVIEDRYFIYDGWNVIEETIAPATGPVETAEHVWGTDLSGTAQGAGGVGGLLLRESSATGASYYHYDGNGNVTALTSAAGTVQAAYTYGPFGETLRAVGPLAQANPWRFSTKYQDDETGLLYYGYRFYNPTDGRWPSRDPIGEEGGRNLYGMVSNAAVNYADRLGLEIQSCAKNETEKLLNGEGVSGWTATSDASNNQVTRFFGNASYSSSSLDSEILGKMIRSPRVFRFKNIENLKMHVKARNYAVWYAKKSIFGFGVGDALSLPKSGWYSAVPGWAPYILKNNLNQLAYWSAFEDLSGSSSNVLPCNLASYYCIIAGGLWADYQGKPGQYSLENQGNLPDDDWIPGDWGRITNTGKVLRKGLEAENIIYVGGTLFWGHLYNLQDGETVDDLNKKRLKTLKSWTDRVDGFDGKDNFSFKIESWRKWTPAGIQK